MQDKFIVEATRMLENYQRGTASKQEKKIIHSWFKQYESIKSPVPISEDTKAILYARITDNINQKAKKKRQKKLLWLSRVAAIFLCSIACYALYNIILPSEQHKQVQTQDHLPGKNTALLTLSSGKEIQLTDQVLLTDSAIGLRINQAQGSISFYKNNSQNTTANDQSLNTIRTPNAGQYTIILSDGSSVKLNANSVLSFPSSFSTERRVSLEGEAFFDVHKGSNKKFIITTAHQQVEVLGTQFNIKSYKEEQTTKTSLFSGRLLVKSTQANDPSSVILEPGQVVTNGEFLALSRNTEAPSKIKSWYNGDFQFDGENLEEIMSVISRWYNVKVIYQVKPSKKVQYGGVISRDKKLSTVLNLLAEQENLTFEIKGKEVIVKQ